MRVRLFPIILLLGVAVAGAMLVTYERWGRRGLGEASAVLPDGGRIVVLKASYGTNHEFVVGRFPWLDPLRKSSAPPWIRKGFGAPTERENRTGQGDGLYLFYAEKHDDGSWAPDPPWAQAVIDEHGCRLSLQQGRGHSTLAGMPMAAQETLVYPRRAAEFDVVFGKFEPSLSDVRVRVRNPRPWRGAEWTPEAMPAVRNVDGLQVTYLGFSTPNPWPKFRVEKDGREGTEWRASRVWIHDATGNRAWGPQLCRLEPAWRIEAGFERVPEFAFGSDEALLIHEGSLPAEGEAIVVKRTAKLLGVDVKVLYLGGPGSFQLESRGGEFVLTGSSNLPSGTSFGSTSWTSSSGVNVTTVKRVQPWLALKLTGLEPDHVWQIVLVDENGKSHSNSGWSGSNDIIFCDLESASAIRSGRIQCIVQRLKTVSFLVAPPAQASN